MSATTINLGKFTRALVLVQGLYIFIMAIWPVIHIDSFMRITGYKSDIWLVKTVAVLLIAISLSCFAHLLINGNFLPAAVLCLGTAIGLTFIDVYYVSEGIIDEIYLLDAGVESIFIVAWLYMVWRIKKRQVG